MHMGFSRIVASALFGAVLLLASGAAAQVPGGVVIKPPFVNGNCVKAVAPGAITTAGNGPCGGGTGTVTSVDVSGGTTGLTFSGGPVTTTGTITMGGGPLTVPFGGTGAASWTAHGLILGNGSSALGITAAGTTGQYLKGVTGADPAWGTISSDLVSSISMGSTGLTPNSATTGAVTVAGTLDVDNGGTGQTSYTNGQLHEMERDFKEFKEGINARFKSVEERGDKRYERAMEVANKHEEFGMYHEKRIVELEKTVAYFQGLHSK